MSDFTIEQLEALKEGTTPGPWGVSEWEDRSRKDAEVFQYDGELLPRIGIVFLKDAELIAAAPELVDALIAEKRAHDKLLRGLDEMLSWWGKSSEKLSARGMEELAEVSRRRMAQLTRILEGDNE